MGDRKFVVSVTLLAMLVSCALAQQITEPEGAVSNTTSTDPSPATSSEETAAPAETKTATTDTESAGTTSSTAETVPTESVEETPEADSDDDEDDSNTFLYVIIVIVVIVLIAICVFCGVKYWKKRQAAAATSEVDSEVTKPLLEKEPENPQPEPAAKTDEPSVVPEVPPPEPEEQKQPEAPKPDPLLDESLDDADPTASAPFDTPAKDWIPEVDPDREPFTGNLEITDEQTEEFSGSYEQHGSSHEMPAFTLVFFPDIAGVGLNKVEASGEDGVGAYNIIGAYSMSTGRLALNKTYIPGTGGSSNSGHTVKIRLIWNAEKQGFEGDFMVKTETYEGYGRWDIYRTTSS